LSDVRDKVEVFATSCGGGFGPDVNDAVACCTEQMLTIHRICQTTTHTDTQTDIDRQIDRHTSRDGLRLPLHKDIQTDSSNVVAKVQDIAHPKFSAVENLSKIFHPKMQNLGLKPTFWGKFNRQN